MSLIEWRRRLLGFQPSGRSSWRMAEVLPRVAWMIFIVGMGDLAPIAAEQPAREPSIEAALSPDGKLVATSHINKTVQLWRTQTGEPVGLARPFPALVENLRWSPGGSYLHVDLDNRPTQVINLRTQDTYWRLPYIPGNEDLEVSFIAEDRIAVHRSSFYRIRLVDTRTGRESGRYDPDSNMPSAQVSPDGRYFVTDCIERFQVRSVTNRAVLWQTDPGSASNGRIGFSPDGQKLIFLHIYADGIPIFDLATGKEIKRLGQGTGEHWARGFSRDGKIILSSVRHNKPELFDVESGKSIELLSRGGSCVNPDLLSAGGRVYVTMETHPIALLRVEHIEERRQVKLFERAGEQFDNLSLSPDGRYVLATLREAKAALLWRADTGELEQKWTFSLKPASL